MQSFLKFRLKFPYKLICGWVADRGVCIQYTEGSLWCIIIIRQHWWQCIVCIFVSAQTDLRITIYLQDTNNLSPCRLCWFSCTTLQCKMVDIDILHHVYFFSRKFVKNPKKMCFCYSGFYPILWLLLLLLGQWHW